MVEPVISLALEPLRDLGIKEAIFLGEVREQVHQMQIQLKMMQYCLKDADKVKGQNERARYWISEVREAAYDAGDAIETYAIERVLRSRGGVLNFIKRYTCFVRELVERHRVGSDITAIRSRISDLATSMLQLSFIQTNEGEISSSSAHGMKQWQLRRSYSHVVEHDVIGFQEHIKELVDQLVEEEKHCEVVSICGMGGSGKTTLAKKVYHHSQVRRHFDGFAWAYISQQFQTRDVLVGILISLSSPTEKQKEEIKRMNEAELAKKLYQFEQEKRCLVVLDDIWSIQAWHRLHSAFPSRETGSKIILTS